MLLQPFVRQHVSQALTSYNIDIDSLLPRVTGTRDSQFGDYQANLSFALILGKHLGRDPFEVAKEVATTLASDELFSTVEVAGKGFINFRLNDSFILKSIQSCDANDTLALTPANPPKTFIVDYSSPNVAKPMHVGHIRSTVIGDSLVQILRAVGHKVISDNHIGDWGTQFGMVIYGYKHFVDPVGYEKAPVHELSRLYRLVQQIIGYQSAKSGWNAAQEKVVKANEALQNLTELCKTNSQDKKLTKNLKSAERSAKDADESLSEIRLKIETVESNQEVLELANKHKDLDQKVLKETALLHSGDATNKQLWEKFLPHCKAEMQTVYDRLHIHFDYELGESYYHDMLGPTVKGLLDSGAAQESQGAICVFLPGFDAPMIIQKQDGAFLYATTDLATVEYRMKQFAPDAILYVVDHRQGDHFQKLFLCLKQTGISNVELKHVSFGTVLGKDGRPFKTRSGTVVGLESLLDEAVSRALQVVCDPSRLQNATLDFSDDEKQHIADVVGIGAIKYADLSHHRENDYEFDLEKMVQLQGNTSAYIQYSYARTQGILRKLDAVDADSKNAAKIVDGIQFTHPLERTLALQLLRFEDALHQSLEDYLPNFVTDYLYETAKLFASFFDQCPVITAETKVERATRRILVSLTGKTLKLGLSLLGIQTVERM